MIRIGIVEDNRTTREGLRTIVDLNPDYICVGAYGDAEEALKLLPRQAPDVVLMDIQLPSMSGIDCVARLKKIMPEVFVIMVTVYEDPDRVFSSLRAGASGYLLKRSAAEQLASAIQEVVNGGAPMSSGIALKVIQYFQDQTANVVDVDKLGPREKEVLELVAQGFNNKEVAARMGVSVDTVRWHLKNIYAKLHVHSRTEAALKFRGSQQ